jgi:hypothetical protein
VYQVDPLLCTRCGKRMSTIAFVTDPLALGKILDHLGLSTPEAEKPPPPVPELLRVAEPKTPSDRVRPHAPLRVQVVGRYRGSLERRASRLTLTPPRACLPSRGRFVRVGVPVGWSRDAAARAARGAADRIPYRSLRPRSGDSTLTEETGCAGSPRRTGSGTSSSVG